MSESPISCRGALQVVVVKLSPLPALKAIHFSDQSLDLFDVLVQDRLVQGKLARPSVQLLAHLGQRRWLLWQIHGIGQPSLETRHDSLSNLTGLVGLSQVVQQEVAVYDELGHP